MKAFLLDYAAYLRRTWPVWVALCALVWLALIVFSSGENGQVNAAVYDLS